MRTAEFHHSRLLVAARFCFMLLIITLPWTIAPMTIAECTFDCDPSLAQTTIAASRTTQKASPLLFRAKVELAVASSSR